MLQPTVKEKGCTVRERYLAKLANNTFFGLWSYPNAYTNEGLSKNNIGKELCDLLVVIDNTAIIFSDKDIKFNKEKNIDVAWKRWFKKSISKSSGQLFGAETWLKNRPQRVYLDKYCHTEFPLDLAKITSIHLIAVTCNISSEISNHFGDYSPSLIQQYDLKEKDCSEKLFHIGDLYPNKSFVHILDEFTLDLLMDELDTVTDFLHYLDTKAASIRGGDLIMASGEEEILASYFQNRDNKTLLGDITRPTGIQNNGPMIFSIGLWEEFIQGDIYQETTKLFKKHDVFDRLIHLFSDHILSGKVGLAQDKSFKTHESAVRHLALEPRISRCILSMAFQDKFDEVPADRRSARLVISPFYKNKAYIFLFLPRAENQSRDDYRKQRYKYNELYAFVAKSQNPDIDIFIVISTEPQGSKERSEDIYYVEYASDLSKEELMNAREISESEGIMENTWKTRSNLWDGVQRNKNQVRNMTPKYKRNELCYCGSGKKYKKCCM